MNKYKALISYELRQVRWIMLYFCLGFAALGKGIESYAQRRHTLFLNNGIGEFSCVNQGFTKMITEAYPNFLIFMLIGIILLAYRQFRENKTGEVGGFLKSLPIKNQKHFLIKVSCGVLTFTIPFILFTAYLLVIKGQHMEWMRELYSMTGLRRAFEILNSNWYVLKILLMYYLLMTFTYLFLVMMQYVVTHVVGSIVLGSMIALVPIYLVECLRIIKWHFTQDRGYNFYDLASYYLPWEYPHKVVSLFDERPCSFLWGITAYVEYIPDLHLFLIILFILCMVCLMSGYYFSKFFKLEMAEHIFLNRIFEWIFIIGVILCCALFPMCAYYLIGMGYMLNISFKVLMLLGLVASIIGGLIAYKITKIGRNS